MQDMKGFLLRTAAAIVCAAAAIIRLFVSRKGGILLISCQSDEPSQDILDLEAAIRGTRVTSETTVEQRLPLAACAPCASGISDIPYVKVMAGRMDRSIGGAFSFTGKLLSMLKEIAAAKVVVLDAYCPAVSIPGKMDRQKVVQIWHAPEAIKKFSLQIVDTPAGYDSLTTRILKMHRNYDFILCPSNATLPFFEKAFGYPENAFVKYGLPSLDRLGVIKRPERGEPDTPERVRVKTAIYEKYPDLDASAGKRPLTIVYAPTFRDGADVDAAGLAHAFEKAMPDAVIVLKLHPLAAAKKAEFVDINVKEIRQENEPRVITDNKFPLIGWYAAADIVITDYSGAAVEAAAAGVASYYYIYDIDEYKERRGLNVDLRDEAVGKYAFKDANELARQALSDFAEEKGPKYDYGALSEFADKYLEVPLTGNTQRLAEFLLNC